MKRILSRQHFVFTLVAAAVLGAAAGVQGQTYTVDYFVLSSGSSTSTNGPFSLAGIIGQPLAGTPLAGGPYTMDVGFWSVAVVSQIPGAPLMRITRSGGVVAISWPASSPAFVLEVTSSLATPIAWQPASQTPLIVGPDNIVSLAAAAGSKFYRLRQASPP